MILAILVPGFHSSSKYLTTGMKWLSDLLKWLSMLQMTRIDKEKETYWHNAEKKVHSFQLQYIVVVS